MKGAIQAVVEFAAVAGSSRGVRDGNVSPVSLPPGETEEDRDAEGSVEQPNGAGVSSCELDERDAVIQDLLLWLERCMQHGLREETKVRQKKADGKYVLVHETEVSIWSYARFFGGLSNKPDLPGDLVENLNAKLAASVLDVRDLLFVRTAKGKSRAWLRHLVSEKILNATVARLVQAKKLVEAYYEDFALLRDEEASAILVSMVSGLNGLEIKLHLDVEWFDTKPPPLRRPVMLVSPSGPDNAMAAPQQATPTASGAQDEQELAALQEKLSRVSHQQGGSWKDSFRQALGRASEVIAGTAPGTSSLRPRGSSGGVIGSGLDLAARSLRRRAAQRRRQRELERRLFAERTPVFGSPLERLSLNPLTCALADMEPRVSVPDVLLRAVAVLWTMVENGALRSDQLGGLFAVRGTENDGVHHHVIFLRQQLERLGSSGLAIYARVGVDVDVDNAFASIAATTRMGMADNFESTPAKVFAALIRFFFRQLPEPLIPFDLYDPLLLCADIDDEDAKLRNVACLLDTLPSSHKSCLDLLLLFLAKICGGEDDSADRIAVAAALGPSLLRPKLVITAATSTPATTTTATPEGGGSSEDGSSLVSAPAPARLGNMGPEALGQFGNASDMVALLIEHHERVLCNVRQEIFEVRQNLSEKLDLIRGLREGLRGRISDDASQTLLKTIWDNLAPVGVAPDTLTPFAMQSPGWKLRGATVDDIAADFRGGGPTALRDLAYFTSKHGTKAHQMVAQARFPFFQAACQVSRLTADVLELSSEEMLGSPAVGAGAAPHHKLAGRPWWGLLDDANATQRVFCMAFLLLDLNYAESKATAMDFNRVAQETKFQMSDLLSLGPQSVNQLWHSWIQLRAERMFWKSTSVESPAPADPEQARLTVDTGKPVPGAAAATALHQAAAHQPPAPPSKPATPSPRNAYDAVKLGQLLPILRDESQVLIPAHVGPLEAALPDAFQGYDWALVYSSQRDKADIADLYAKAGEFAATLLVIKDSKGAVFGGFTAEPWALDESRQSYFGSRDSFVFTLEPSFQVFLYAGGNEYFQLANEDSLAMGGGGELGFLLDEDMQSGTSGPCDTFQNPCLASDSDFDAQCVELWTFRAKSCVNGRRQKDFGPPAKALKRSDRETDLVPDDRQQRRFLAGQVLEQETGAGQRSHGDIRGHVKPDSKGAFLGLGGVVRAETEALFDDGWCAQHERQCRDAPAGDEPRNQELLTLA
ncbi:Oxidation resistance protein 1 (Protein C7), partial [Durusdinium trenchii]